MNEFLQGIGYTHWILPVLLVVPLAGAAILWIHGFVAERAGLTGLASDAFARWVTFATLCILFVLSAGLWWAFDPAGGWQFQFSVPWLPGWGITFTLALDGISIFLVLLTTFLAPIATLSAWTSVTKRVHTYHALFLVLTTGMLGVFIARDAFLFYVMWELVLVPMFFIIGVWGGERRMYAATKFFIYTFIGSLLMLLAIRRQSLSAEAGQSHQHPDASLRRRCRGPDLVPRKVAVSRRGSGRSDDSGQRSYRLQCWSRDCQRQYRE